MTDAFDVDLVSATMHLLQIFKIIMKNAIGWIAVIILVLWGLNSVVGNKKADIGNLDVYKVGAIAPLSGDAAAYGESFRNTLLIALDEINSSGGINGKKMELIIEDGKCNGEGAVNAAQKLVNVDKVQVIIGGFCSAESLSALPVAEAGKVALFSPASSNPSLSGKSKFFFRNFPSDSSQGAILAQAAFDSGKRKVAFIQEQTDYTAGVFKSFTEKFESLGGTTVKEEYGPAVKDFKSQLTKLQATNADALFINANTPASTEIIVQQVSALNWNTSLFTNDIIVSSSQTLAKYKKELNGLIGAEFTANDANPKFKHLLDAYKAKFGVELPYQSYSQTVYDAIYIVREAIGKVGYNGVKIAEFGRGLTNWEGAAGSITIDSNGDLVGGHRARIFKDGKLENLK